MDPDWFTSNKILVNEKTIIGDKDTKKWIESLPKDTLDNFTARRYMDDILLLYVQRHDFDNKKFIQDFECSTCYASPLTLEDGKSNTFLETCFEITEQN